MLLEIFFLNGYLFGISKIYPYYEVKNFSQNFGKTALFGVVGRERKIKEFGKLPKDSHQQAKPTRV